MYWAVRQLTVPEPPFRSDGGISRSLSVMVPTGNADARPCREPIGKPFGDLVYPACSDARSDATAEGRVQMTYGRRVRRIRSGDDYGANGRGGLNA
jgi:hypothetical protein